MNDSFIGPALSELDETVAYYEKQVEGFAPTALRLASTTIYSEYPRFT